MEWLGEKLTKYEVQRRFPSDRYGVNLSSDKKSILSLKMVISRSKRGGHINEIVNKDIIAFAESPSPTSNQMLKDMVGSRDMLRIHIVFNSEDFDYGYIRVKDIDNSKETKRFILERVNDYANECSSCTSETAVCNISQNKRFRNGEVSIEITSGDNVEYDAKRPRNGSEAKFSSNRPEWTRSGFKYDSRLETQHACFFESMNISYDPHCVTVMLRDGELETYYTPDFYLKDIGPHGTHVEIKPRYPHEEEWMKAELMAKNFRCDVLVLYGRFEAGMPFSNENKSAASLSSRRHYKHHDAIRGILWRGKDGTRTEGVVWGIDEESSSPIIVYRQNIKDCKWDSPALHEAYLSASKYNGIDE